MSFPARPAHPLVVSFDLDGVIMQGPFGSGVRPRLREHFVATPGLSHLGADAADQHGMAAVREAHHRRLAEGDLVGAWDWDAIYAEVIRGFGGTDVPDVATLVRECCRDQAFIKLLPGARSALERLHTAGLAMVAVSNGYHAYQWPVLDALGVGHFFSRVVTPDVAGFAKPNPHIFDGIVGLVAHVGDTPVHDMAAANLAGIRAIWIDSAMPTELPPIPPERRVREPVFRRRLTQEVRGSVYADYHPEATVNTCFPDAVVADADEAATVILEWQASGVLGTSVRKLTLS